VYTFYANLLLSEGKLGNVDSANCPGLATVTGRHVAGDARALAHGVDVVGVSDVENDLGVGPLCAVQEVSL
jgi:hypothetical protein